MLDYDIIDLSAHGPRRGLLNCDRETMQTPKPAPPIVDGSTYREHELGDTTRDRVFVAATKQWQTRRELMARSGCSKESVRAAVRQLIASRFLEAQIQQVPGRQARTVYRRTR